MQNAAEKEGWSQSQADFMIALVATAWGSSYVMMKVGLEGIPPLSLTALRFGIAFVCIAAIFPKELKKTTPQNSKKKRYPGCIFVWNFCISAERHGDYHGFKRRIFDQHVRGNGSGLSLSAHSEISRQTNRHRRCNHHSRHRLSFASGISGIPFRRPFVSGRSLHVYLPDIIHR